MVDEEVEKILHEIRERVRSRELPAGAIAKSAMRNGDGETSISSTAAAEASVDEALARIESYLATTSRAWERLPPLVSNRTGSLASLELWLKRTIKRATHWFTWEQVNFNANVHHALRETLQTLSNYQLALERLDAQRKEEREQNHAQLVSQRGEIETQRDTIEAQRATLEAQRATLEALRTETKAQRGAIEAQQAQLDAQRNQMNAGLSELSNDLRVNHEQAQDEQRVCFKQLSLEATEAAVLEDRARRATETLLEELKRRVQRLESESEK